MFLEVLQAGVKPVADETLEALNLVMSDFHVSFEVELGSVGFVAVRSHAAVKVHLCLVHYLHCLAIMPGDSLSSNPLRSENYKMARPIPRLDLGHTYPLKSDSSVFADQSSSSAVVCITTPSLDSPLRPEQALAPVIPLPSPKQDRDFVLLYRLSWEGQLIKVVRRRDFGPVDVGKLSKYHHRPLPMLQQRVRLSEPTIGLQPEGRKSPSPRRNSFHSETKPLPPAQRSNSSLSSVSLMAAKRLLNTTLSLEYGPEHKKIRVTSSAEDFEEYYKHRYQRQVKSNPAPSPQVVKPYRASSSAVPGKAVKVGKMSKKLRKLLVEIEAGRGDIQTKSFLQSRKPYRKAKVAKKKPVEGLGRTQTCIDLDSQHSYMPEITISSSFAHSRTFSQGLGIRLIKEVLDY